MSPPTTRMSPLQKDVAIRFGKGLLDCADFRHYKLVHSEGQEFPHAVQRDFQGILNSMAPYQRAVCKCERDALKWGTRLNRTGMLQTEWILPGAECIGIGKVDSNNGAKRVMGLNYRLTSEQFSHLHKMHPEWLFVTVRSDGHDHPVAHTATKVVMHNLMEGLKRGTAEQPRRVLDLYGNPGSNEQINNRDARIKIDTNCFAWTAKDFGRKLEKWGPEIGSDGQRRYYDCDLRSMDGTEDRDDVPRISTFDEIVACHSLYYFNPDDICRLVNISGKPLKSVYHKFAPGNKTGSLNLGEQTWERYNSPGPLPSRRVRQTTVKTGLTYDHYDNAWLHEAAIWSHSSNEVADANGQMMVQADGRCMAWDIQEMNDETMKVTFYPIPAVCYNAELAQGARTTPGTVAVCVKQTKKKKSAAVRANGSAEVDLGGKTITYDVPSSGMEVFENARIRMSGRPRTPAQFRDHNAWVKVQCKGVMAKPGCNVTADNIGDIVNASFWIDVAKDLSDGSTASLEKMVAGIKSDKLYTSGTVGTLTNTFDHFLELATIALGAKNRTEAASKSIMAFRTFCRLK